MPLNSAELAIRLKARQTGTSDYGGPEFAPELEHILQFSTGTLANQADLLFVDERTLAASTNDDLDLAGVLVSAFGQTITFAEIVAIVVVNKPRSSGAPANTSNLTVGGGTNPVTGYLGGTTPTIGPIKPGGVALLATGDATGVAGVTGGTADILRIANGAGGSATYQIAILGRSA